MINGTVDGIAGSVDNPVDLTFIDQGLVVDVVIKNASGDVIVRGKPNEATGDTTARIEPRIEIRTVRQRKAKLDEIQWDVQMEQNDHGGQTLTIDVRSIDQDAWFAGADIEVDTPRLGNVRVDTWRGKIIVDDNRGPVDLTTAEGEIRVRTPWPMTQPCAMVTKMLTLVGSRAARAVANLIAKHWEEILFHTVATVDGFRWINATIRILCMPL